MTVKNNILTEDKCKVYESLSVSESDENKDNNGYGGTRQKLLIVFLMGINFLYGNCYSELAPFFPEEAKKKHVSSSVTGWIVGTLALSRMIAIPAIGLFMSRIGVKFLYNSGCIIAGVSIILFGCPSGWIFIFMCVLCRAFEGIGMAISLTARYVIITVACPTVFAKVNGFVYSSFEVGTMVGPPLGGVLYTYGGFLFTFITTGSTLLVVSALSTPFVPSVEDNKEKTNKSACSILKNVKIVICACTIFIVDLSWSYFEPTLEIHLLKLRLSPMTIGLMFLFCAASSSLGMIICSFINDKKPWQIEMMVLGTVITCISFLLIGPAPFLPFIPFDIWTVVVAMTCLGFGTACSMNAVFMYIFKVTKTLGWDQDLEMLGMVSVVVNMAKSTGLFFGPMASGTLTDYFGFDWANCFPAGLNILNTIAVISMGCLDRYSVQKDSSDP